MATDNSLTLSEHLGTFGNLGSGSVSLLTVIQ